MRFEGGFLIEYHNDSTKTAGAYDHHGSPTVGDVGYLDDQGYLFLTDRKGFMIIAGGVNIYPQETEDVLLGHPAVADVAVFGVPNPDLGEGVKAVVELIDSRSAGRRLEMELIAHCMALLAPYKCPRSVDFIDELPTSPAGELYKRRLRDTYWGVSAFEIGDRLGHPG